MAEPTYREVGRSRTRTTPQGKTIPVLPPDDTNYLCEHICYCNCNARLSSSGQVLRQRCVSNSIRRECDAARQIWKYKGEVGYNMRNSPPTPLMSAAEPNRPSAFPLGVMMGEGAFSKRELEGRPQRGLLRIPDVILVKDMLNLSLAQPNVEFVLEIKFPGDTWRAGQEQDYQRIAGDPDRLKVLTPDLCKCKPCRQPEKERAPVTVPENRTAEDKTNILRKIREHNAFVDAHPMPYLYDRYIEPTPLAENLKTGAMVVGALAVAYVAVTIGGPLLLVLLAVSATASAEENKSENPQ